MRHNFDEWTERVLKKMSLRLINCSLQICSGGDQYKTQI